MVVYVVEPTLGCTKNVMLYGHLDKQPWMEGWDEGLGPCDPVIRGEYLYGRGGADDGYSPFSCMLAIKNLQLQGVKTPRCALVLETEEESGSPNLLRLLDCAKDFIGAPDFCFCMDSGAFDYNQLWCTSSLRGINIVELTVEFGKSGYHSGEVGGIIPETFRIIRDLLNRIDDPKTGRVVDDFQVEIPQWAKEEAQFMANLSGAEMHTKYDYHEGAKPMDCDNLPEMYLNNTWRSNLSITGAAGLPDTSIAGNVVRASTSVKLSLRLPPSAKPAETEAKLIEILSKDVPYNAKVTVKGGHAGQGWCMKDQPAWLSSCIKKAGSDFFDGKDAGTYGMGGSIPFLAELDRMYPNTFILALGLIGPKANAHAPNECINLTYAKKLTKALSHLIAEVGAKTD
jgi:acetylornithine deacetylase/succinyl-diaminopimelate desuccinylase-like protein